MMTGPDTGRPPKGESGDRLRDLLRAGDPAADGCDPTAEETAAWKRRLMTAPAVPGWSRRATFGWAAAAVVMAAVAALLILPLRTRGRGDRAGSGLEAGRRAGGSAVARNAKRKPLTIQFRAPNGTRIFWTLNPDLSLPETGPRKRIEGEAS